QVLAATTNGTAGSQTFGISFGTSNCGENQIDRRSEEREVFLQYNFANLKKDAARGDGQYITAFAELWGCGQTEVVQFKKYTQSRFSALFDTEDPKAVMGRY